MAIDEAMIHFMGDHAVHGTKAYEMRLQSLGQRW